MLNCNNHINLTKFPPQHDRVLSPSGLGKKLSANVVYESGSSVWYPDLGVMNHVTYDVGNLQLKKACEGECSINTVDGRAMDTLIRLYFHSTLEISP